LGCHQERDGFINQSKVGLIREVPFDKILPSWLYPFANTDLHKLMEETLKSYFERIGEKEISQ